MSEPIFADRASSCFALAAQILGWRPPEFWAATPRELAAAFADPKSEQTTSPTREWIVEMMERDNHE